MKAGLIIPAILLATTAGAGLASAHGPEQGGEHPLVTPRLMADTAAVEPGQSFRLGVMFQMHEGWHIYWRNSGDTGMPTALTPQLPEGFTVGQLHWPAPTRFVEGDLVSFGYDGRVLLWFDVTAPKNLAVGSRVELGMRANWLACKKECVIGDAELALTLDVVERSRKQNTRHFDYFSDRLPVPVGDDTSPARAKVRVGGEGGGDNANQQATVKLAWESDVTDVHVFPAADGLLINESDYTHEGRQTHIALGWSALGAAVEEQALSVVVTFTDQHDKRRSVVVDVIGSEQRQRIATSGGADGTD